MNKKILYGIGVLGVSAIGGVGAVVLIPTIVSAAQIGSNSNFAQLLSQKLGIDQAKVESALNSVKTDRLAQKKVAIQTAVNNGKLTQRQGDLIIALQDNNITMEKSSDPTMLNIDNSNLTQEQKKAEMLTKKAAKEQTMVVELNKKGLNTTLDEIQKAMQAERNAGINSRTGRFGFKI